MKFTTKLMLIYLGFTLGITLPVSLFLYLSSSQIAETQIKKHLQERAEHVMDKIDRKFFERLSDIQILANDPIIANSESLSKLQLTKRLSYFLQFRQAYLALAIFDKDKIKIADTLSIGLNQPAPETAWVQDVYAHRKVSAGSDIYVDRALKKPVIAFAAPIINEQQEFKGAVVGYIYVESIYSIFGEFAIDDHSIGFDLFDNQKRLLYSSHDKKNRLKIVDFNNNHKDEFYTVTKEKGYALFQGNEWLLFIHYKPENVFAPLITLRNQSLGGSVLLLVLATSGLFLFARKFIRPVTILQEAALQIGKGNFKTKVVVSSKDEIGQLGKCFNKMTELLEQYIAERDRAENALKLSQFALDHASDMVTWINLEGQFTYVNNAVCHALGYRQAALLSMSLPDITKSFTARTLPELLNRIEKNGATKIETAYLPEAGNPIPVEITINYLSFDGKNYFCAFARNISERKRAEKLLQEYNFQLEQEVSTQTEELAAQNEELTQHTQILRQKEEFLRTIIDNIPQLIFWKDTHSVYQGCNLQVAQLNGFSRPEEIIGKTDFDLSWRQWAEEYRKDDQRVIANNVPELNVIEKEVDSEGYTNWLEVNKIPLHDHQHRVIGVLNTIENITERKNAEELQKEYNQRLESEVAKQTLALTEKTQLLEKEQEKFTTVLDSLESIVYVADMQTYEILFVNQYTRKLFADNVNDLMIGKRCWEVIQHNKTGPCAFCTNDKLLDKEGEPIDVYTWEYQHSVNQHWYYLQDRAIRWTDGRIVRLEIATDITKLKEAEQTLRQNEKYLRSYFEQPLVGMMTISPEKGILQVNNTLCEMSGYSRKELLTMGWTEITYPDDASLDVDHFAQMLAGKIKAYTIDKRFVRKNGKIIYSTISVSCVHSDNGEVERIVVLAIDISKRKQAELALQEAKKAADIANKAKSNFLANMSHELRTPLNGILGYTQILMWDENTTEKQREGLEIIDSSGEYLLTLINDILDLSKIEADRVELYPTDVNFHKFLQGITDLFRVRAEQKGIDFIYEPLSYLPLGVYVDEKRLRQVLINLLGNSVKFTEKGTVTLKVGYHQGKIRFQIEDTGIGIGEEDLETIFKPFQQSGSDNYKAEGTGLGLAITERIVELMGGRIYVESTLGEGSTFWFAIDLPKAKNPIQEEQEIEKNLSPIIGFEGDAKIILLIDAKWENRSVIVNLLMPLGFKIVEASNGQEGIDKAIEIQPDLIMTDLVLPVVDGLEVVKCLRERLEFKHTPIFAVTASVFDYDQKQSYNVGCNAFIPKPFRAEMLLENLQKFLNLTWIHSKTSQKDVFEVNLDHQ